MALTDQDILELYLRHAEELLAFFARRVCVPEVAVDLVAETFATAFEQRSRCHGERDAGGRAWLFGIARNLLADYFRDGRIERAAVERLGIQRRPLTDEEHDRIEELAVTSGLREEVVACIDRLPATQRQALQLRIVEERPYYAVAASLNTTEQSARARVSRALRTLRQSRSLIDLKKGLDHA